MSGPQRIQLSRRRGWRKPEGAVKVSRGTAWGNPFRVYEHCRGTDGDWGVADSGRFDLPMTHGWTREGAHRFAVDAFRREFEKLFPPGSLRRHAMLEPLRGRDLACWCPLDEPCHADVLLELANGEPS